MPDQSGRGPSLDTACTHDGSVHTWGAGCPGFTGRRPSPVVCGCGDIKRPMGHVPSDHRETAGDAWLRRARLRAVGYGLAFGVVVAGGSLLALRGVEAIL